MSNDQETVWFFVGQCIVMFATGYGAGYLQNWSHRLFRGSAE